MYIRLNTKNTVLIMAISAVLAAGALAPASAEQRIMLNPDETEAAMETYHSISSVLPFLDKDAVMASHTDTNFGCYYVILDNVHGLFIKEFCSLWELSEVDSLDRMSISDHVYDMGDRLDISIARDSSDTAPSSLYDLTITDQEGNPVAHYAITSASELPDSLSMLITLDRTSYQTGSCYHITGYYDTDRNFDDESWNSVSFCIAPVMMDPDYSDDVSVSPTILKGTVFNDTNTNGIKDTGEAGIAGKTVLYIDMTDPLVTAQTTTDSAGNYVFENITAGHYLVQVEGTNLFNYLWISAGETKLQNFAQLPPVS